MKITVTGSEGFVGQHVIPKLMAADHDIIGIDSLIPQVHGETDGFHEREYEFMPHEAGLIYGHPDIVIHLAAKVGVGQSMYQPFDYVRSNSTDTALMLEALTDRKPKKLIVASSMSIYGEGYQDCGVRENHPPDLRSIYALTKYDQEQLCLIWGRTHNVPVIALRFFNIYGPGQALTNPYTGVMAIFATRLLNGNQPVIYGDGQQSRDFIHVDDIARAVVHAVDTDMESGAYNVGTRVPTTILEAANTLAAHLNPDIVPNVTYQLRPGDIRHCYADNSKIRKTGWEPQVMFLDGMKEYCDWLKTQPVPEDKFDKAAAELEEHGLVK